MMMIYRAPIESEFKCSLAQKGLREGGEEGGRFREQLSLRRRMRRDDLTQEEETSRSTSCLGLQGIYLSRCWMVGLCLTCRVVVVFLRKTSSVTTTATGVDAAEVKNTGAAAAAAMRWDFILKVTEEAQ